MGKQTRGKKTRKPRLDQTIKEKKQQKKKNKARGRRHEGTQRRSHIETDGQK